MSTTLSHECGKKQIIRKIKFLSCNRNLLSWKKSISYGAFTLPEDPSLVIARLGLDETVRQPEHVPRQLWAEVQNDCEIDLNNNRLSAYETWQVLKEIN